MNENDKILLNSYIYDETSDDENKYVEDLIKDNPEASDYINALKMAKIEIDEFFDSSKINHLDGIQSIDNSKIDYLKLFSIDKIFTKYSIPGYALTLLFGIFISSNLVDSNDLNIDSLSNQTLSIQIPITRANDDIKNNIDIVVEKMLRENIRSSSLEFVNMNNESSLINIEITEKLLDEPSECYLLKVKNENNFETLRMACISNEIFFINDLY